MIEKVKPRAAPQPWEAVVMEAFLGLNNGPQGSACLSGQLGAVGAMWDCGVVGEMRALRTNAGASWTFWSTSAVVCKTS